MTKTTKHKFKIPKPDRSARGIICGAKVQIACRFDADIFEAINRYSIKTGRSMSNAIQSLCAESLNARQ